MEAEDLVHHIGVDDTNSKNYHTSPGRWRNRIQHGVQSEIDRILKSLLADESPITKKDVFLIKTSRRRNCTVQPCISATAVGKSRNATRRKRLDR